MAEMKAYSSNRVQLSEKTHAVIHVCVQLMRAAAQDLVRVKRDFAKDRCSEKR